jgi:hypothetical protein
LQVASACNQIVRVHTQRAANVAINMIVPWNAKNHVVAAMCGITLGIVAHSIIIQPQNRRVRGTLRSNLNALCQDETWVVLGSAATLTRISAQRRHRRSGIDRRGCIPQIFLIFRKNSCRTLVLRR